MNGLPQEQLSIKDMVEIHAPGIDVDEIMVTIRRNIQARRETTPTVQFPEFEDIICPEEVAEGDHASLQHFLLREMNKTAVPHFQTTPELAPSFLNKVPGVGFLWNVIRRHMHSLSIFYANKMGRQIATHNRYPVTVLNVMTRLNQKRDAELAALKQRVVDLETKLADLEQKR